MLNQEGKVPFSLEFWNWKAVGCLQLLSPTDRGAQS